MDSRRTGRQMERLSSGEKGKTGFQVDRQEDKLIHGQIFRGTVGRQTGAQEL